MIRMIPPLTISEQELEKGMDVLEASLAAAGA